jgi:hypothetical protein
MKTRARVSVPPNGTIPEALKVTGSDCRQEKAGGGFTITGVVPVVDPPLPVQVMLYVVLVVGETEREPEAPEGKKPAPLHEVALVDAHESLEEAPGVMDAGFALNMSVGALADAGARALCPTHPIRLSAKATCHHV